MIVCAEIVPLGRSLHIWKGKHIGDQANIVMNSITNLLESCLVSAIKSEKSEILALSIFVGDEVYLLWIEDKARV